MRLTGAGDWVQGVATTLRALTVHTAPLDELSPEALLDLPGATPRGFFSDAHGTTAWLGAARVVTAEGLASLSERAAQAWDGVTYAPAHPPRAFVTARFSNDARERDDPAWRGAPGALWILPTLTLTRTGAGCVAQWVLPEGEAPPSLPPSPPPSARSPRGIVNVRSLDGARARWDALVRDALAAIESGALEKVVAARRVALEGAAPWSLSAVLRSLAPQERAGCTRFAVSYEGVDFVGATPETLLSREGGVLQTEALAGTLPRRPAHDDEDRAALLASEKDLREHALVTQMIVRTIAPWSARVDRTRGPELRSLEHLHHLWTPIRAQLRADAPSLLTMAGALHPTPAMAGAPVAEATRWIAAHEEAPRGWYAGVVGHCDARGDGRCAVGIRSAVLRGPRAWVYAGAGLVRGSDPAREWDETAAKMSLMRAALGAEAR